MRKRLLVGLSLVVGCGAPDGGAPAGGDAADGGARIDLTLGDQGVVLEGSTQTCRVTAGIRFGSAIQAGPEDPRELTMQFLSVAEGVDWAPLSRQGNMTGVRLQPGGGFDVVDLDDDVRQIIVTESVCEFDMTYVATEQLAPGITADRYNMAFSCPTLPFAIVSTETSEGRGQSTVNLSGSYDCHMSAP